MEANDPEARRAAYREAWKKVAGEQAGVFDGLSIEEIGVARQHRVIRAAAQAGAIAEQQARLTPTDGRSTKRRR